MESIYYVISWLCHRRCVHCYEDRFRPYVRDDLARVVDKTTACWPRIVDNLPDSMIYRDMAAPLPEGGFAERVGRVILSGGEVLVEPIREPVLYPLIRRLGEKYRDAGGVRIVVQTTGDLLSEKILDELLEAGAWQVSVTGMDDFHVGMEGEKRQPLIERLTAMFEARGMVPTGRRVKGAAATDASQPVYSFMGANPDEWIGAIWPRGRAWQNDLSTATLADNFCNAWSGGLNFLNRGWSGSEVSIEPNGNLYPCCLKTRLPLGNLTEETLTDILDSLVGHPVFEAINAGHPERMGLAHGWDVARFLEESRTETVSGRPYRNLCVGCDRFHEQVLGPIFDELRRARLARRAAA